MKTLATLELKNELKHTIDINNSNANIIIKIKLADECKNGHNDFSITASVYEIGKVRNDRNMISAGCCHGDILKVRPDLKIFVDLHLSNVEGTPMYAIENGYYHLHNSTLDVAANYLRVNLETAQILKDAPDKLYFAYLLNDLKVVQQWRKEAAQAIKVLEELTGFNFQDNSAKLEDVAISSKDKKTIEKRIKEGYYIESAINERKNIANELALQNAINKLTADKDKDVLKITNEFNIMLEILKFGLSIDNVIYYPHTNECVFNWDNSSYRKNVTESDYKSFISKVNFNRLPKGLVFKFINRQRLS